MKFQLVVLISAVLLGGAGVAIGADPVDSTGISSRALGDSEFQFAARLYEATAQQADTNLALSPMSAFESLLLLRAGAGGDTQRAINRVMGLPVEESAAAWRGLGELQQLGAERSFFFPGFVLDNRGFGVRVAADPAANSKASASGLRRDDLIFTVDSLPVRTKEDFASACDRSAGTIDIDGFDFSTGRPIRRMQVPLEVTSAASSISSRPVVTASAIWLSNSVSIRSDYADRLEAQFRTRVFPTSEFQSHRIGKEASAYFRRRTAGRIDEIQVSGLSPDARFLLIHGAAMNAKWRFAFNPKDSTIRPFASPAQAMDAHYMQTTAPIRFAQMPDYRVAELPLRGGNLAMRIYLPNKAGAWRQLEQKWMASDENKAVLSKLARTEVELLIPRFRVEANESLKNALSSIGLSNLFSNQADFRGISTNGNLKLGEVSQQTFVEIDEEGIRAGAVTQILGVVKGYAAATPEQFHVVHPFLFQIVDASGPVFFCGRVLHPTPAGP